MKKLLTFLALVATATLGLSQGRNISINPATKKLIYPLPADAAALGEINALAYLTPNDALAQDTNKIGWRAMAAFAAARTQTSFVLPDGDIYLNCDFFAADGIAIDPINFPSGTSIRGGKKTRIIVDNNGSTERWTVFRFLGSSDCKISGLEIKGDRTTALAGSNYGFGIAFEGTCLNNALENIVVRDCYTDGIYFNGSRDHRNNNVEVFNSRRSNVSIVDGQRISWVGFRFSGANGPVGIEAGVDMESQTVNDISDISFIDGLIDGNGTDGLTAIKGSGAGVPKRISVLRVTFDGNGGGVTAGTGGGILNLRGEDVSVNDCTFLNQVGDNIRFDKLTRGQINNCHVLDGNRGIYILASSGIKVLNNGIKSTADTGIDTVDNDPLFPLVNCQIEGNTIEDTGGFYGIDFRGSYSSISGNFINGTQRNSILVLGLNNKVVGNQPAEAGLAADNTYDAISASGFGHTIVGNIPKKCVVSQSGTAGAAPVAVTGVAATNLFTVTSHGFSAGYIVYFPTLTGGAGLTAGTPVYYVIASGLTANAFKVSATSGGAEIDFTTDLTAGTVGAIGSATTIILPATRSVQDDILNGYKIEITAGTGSGQIGTISDYVGATGVVTVSAPWTTAPDNTSEYEVIPAGNQQRYGVFNISDRALIFGNSSHLAGKSGALIDQGTNTSNGQSSDIGVATGTSLALSGTTTALGYIATGAGGLSATTGSLNVGSDARATNVTSYMNSAVGFTRFIQFATGGVARWQIGAGNDAESGSDVGTPFRIGAYTDAGAFIDWPVVIGRAAGDPITLDRPTIAPSFSGDGANLTSIAASNIDGPFGDISMTGTLTREGAQILVETALTNDASIEIDLTKGRSTLTVNSDELFVFLAVPPTGTKAEVALMPDSVDRVITIPSCYSFEAGGAVTTFTQRANQRILLGFIRRASDYEVIGVPVADILGSTITLAEGGSTATPAAATSKVYVKADGLWYGKDDAGVETALSNAAGGGTVTATGGALTANAVVLGAGTTDTKVVAGVTTDGAAALQLGVAGTSVGSIVVRNATSGALTISPPTGALGTGAITLPLSGTLAVLGANTFTGTQDVGSNLIKLGTTVNDSSLKHSGTNRELSVRNGDDTLYNYLRLRGIAVWSGADKISGLDYNNPGIEFISGSMVAWGSSATSLSAADTGIKRNAAGVVEINNGTAGAFRDIKARAGTFTTTLASTATTPATLGAAATTLAVTSNVATVTGDGGGNTLATITGGVSGMVLVLIFADALVTITDDASGTANTVNLSAAWTGSADDTLTLVHNGTSWRETARSVN